MKRYTNTAILRQDSLSTGNADEGVSIRVFIAGSVTVEASLFSDVGGTTPIVQPFTSQAIGGDMPGQFSFYVAGGLYDIYFNFGTGSVTSIKNQSISSEVSVKDFGAVGDGTTDDSAAIQAASDSMLASGGSHGELVFPFSGGEVYSIETTLTITNTRTKWVGQCNPDKRTGAGAEANSIVWNGASGGTMLIITNPLDIQIESLGFNGNDIADYGVRQNQANAGNGGSLYDNLTVEKCNKNLWTMSGAVDGGRNRFTRCVFRKTNSVAGTEVDDAIIRYLDSDNVIDRYIECEFIHSDSGVVPTGSVGFYVSVGSPDIYIESSFLKCETNLIQSNDGTGIAYWNVINTYVESANFWRADKSGLQRQDFVNVRHVGTGGDSINMMGNTNGEPLNIINCDFSGDIAISGRDDFPIILVGTRYNSLTLDTSAGDFTNLLQIGRTQGSSNTSSAMINAQGFCTAFVDADTDGNLNVGLQNGSIFKSQRGSGASVTVKTPTAVIALDKGREIQIWLEHTGAGADVNVTWESGYKGNSLPTTISALTTNIFTFIYDGTSWFNTSSVTGIT